jgi:hypothetical protein
MRIGSEIDRAGDIQRAVETPALGLKRQERECDRGPKEKLSHAGLDGRRGIR